MFFLQALSSVKISLLFRLKGDKYSIQRLEKIEKKLVRHIIHKLSGREMQELLAHIDKSKVEIKSGYHYAGKLPDFMAKSLGIGYKSARALIRFLEDEKILCYRCHQDIGELIELSINKTKAAKYQAV
jgi:hypothetical protein